MSTFGPVQNVTGGFGGGHGHLSHLAPSYAAVLSLIMTGDREAYEMIDRKAMYVDRLAVIRGQTLIEFQVALAGRNEASRWRVYDVQRRRGGCPVGFLVFLLYVILTLYLGELTALWC